jgi:hypothetical protein
VQDAGSSGSPVETYHSAGRLMALLPMTGHLGNEAFVEGEIPFSRSSNGGFWSGNVENALSFNMD